MADVRVDGPGRAWTTASTPSSPSAGAGRRGPDRGLSWRSGRRGNRCTCYGPRLRPSSPGWPGMGRGRPRRLENTALPTLSRSPAVEEVLPRVRAKRPPSRWRTCGSTRRTATAATPRTTTSCAAASWRRRRRPSPLRRRSDPGTSRWSATPPPGCPQPGPLPRPLGSAPRRGDAAEVTDVEQVRPSCPSSTRWSRARRRARYRAPGGLDAAGRPGPDGAATGPHGARGRTRARRACTTTPTLQRGPRDRGAHQSSDHPGRLRQAADAGGGAGTGATAVDGRRTCCRSGRGSRSTCLAAARGLVRRVAGARLLQGLGTSPRPAGDPLLARTRSSGPLPAAAGAGRLSPPHGERNSRPTGEPTVTWNLSSTGAWPRGARA